MTDSYHFRIEPEPRAEVPKFRIGGVYRDGFGTLYRLAESSDSACAFAQRDNGLGGWLKSVNLHRLADGRFAPIADPDDKYHLVPGELVQRNGQWVPADTIGPFGSGASLKTAGDKIVGRVEADPLSIAIARLAASIEADLMKLPNPAPEPQREPLDWNTATPFEPFGSDFIVTKGAEPTKPLHTSPTTQGAYPAIAGLLRG